MVLFRSGTFFMLALVMLAVTSWSPQAHADTRASGDPVSLFLQGPDGGGVLSNSVSGSTDVRVARISTAVLSSAPQRLNLSLTGGAFVVATKRPEVSVDPLTTLLKPVKTSVATTARLTPGQTIAFAADNRNLYAGVPVWIGDVDDQPNPGTGAVVLVMQPDGTTYGSVRYIDSKTKKLRSFRITPIRGNGTSAATSTTSASSAPHTIKEVPETRRPLRQNDAPVPRGVNFNDPKVVAKWDLSLAARLGDGSAPTIPPGAAKPVHIANNTSAKQLPLSSTSPKRSGAVAATSAAVNRSAAVKAGARRKLQQTTVTQDLLAVYTSSAASAVGGTDNMEYEIRMQVGLANKAYLDSGIYLEIRLVAIRQVTGWSEAGKDANTCLWETQNGIVPNVITWKNELGADLVTMWANNKVPGDVCGRGNIMGQTGFASARGFSSISGYCLTDAYTLSHELGHNQGCDHNVGVDSGGWQAYSYGWRRCTDNLFKTIMSYECVSSTGNTIATPETGLFSTPDRTVTINGASYAVGDAATSNCARTISESSTIIADFTPTMVTTQTGSEIRTRHNTNLCIDASSYDNGGVVYLYGCHGEGNQKWEQLVDGTVRLQGTNKCLDVSQFSSANGAKIVVWDCNGGLNQKWTLDGDGRLHPYHAPDKCLDVPGGQATEGNQLQIWDCEDVNWHKWNMAPVSFPVFSPSNQGIKSRYTNMCLDVFNYNFNNGEAVVMWPCNGKANQGWVMDASGQLRSTADSNKCLEASANNKVATVYIFDCSTGPNQRWLVDGLGRLRPYSDINKCLDIKGGNTAQQTPVQLWDCLVVPQQKWYL